MLSSYFSAELSVLLQECGPDDRKSRKPSVLFHRLQENFTDQPGHDITRRVPFGHLEHIRNQRTATLRGTAEHPRLFDFGALPRRLHALVALSQVQTGHPGLVPLQILFLSTFQTGNRTFTKRMRSNQAAALFHNWIRQEVF